MLLQVQHGHSQELLHYYIIALTRLITFPVRAYINASWTASVLVCRGVGGGFEAHVISRLGNYPFRAWCYHLGWPVLQHWVCTASKRRPAQPSGCSGHAVCSVQHQVQFGFFLRS